ncbi:MAG: hypothetical protein KAQ99_08580 [Candidatus Aureabacteria bacterium]|nr:hypothetical protein [Candidatus Auribacterota bacterium]
MKLTTVLMIMVILLSVSMANVSAKTEHELTEIENLKLINIDYKVKDLQNQYANLKRNLSAALNETQQSKNRIIKDIEKRLNIKPGEYKIKSNKIIMKPQSKKINEKINEVISPVMSVDKNQSTLATEDNLEQHTIEMEKIKELEEKNEIIFGPEEK